MFRNQTSDITFQNHAPCTRHYNLLCMRCTFEFSKFSIRFPPIDDIYIMQVAYVFFAIIFLPYQSLVIQVCLPVVTMYPKHGGNVFLNLLHIFLLILLEEPRFPHPESRKLREICEWSNLSKYYLGVMLRFYELGTQLCTNFLWPMLKMKDPTLVS